MRWSSRAPYRIAWSSWTAASSPSRARPSGYSPRPRAPALGNSYPDISRISEIVFMRPCFLCIWETGPKYSKNSNAQASTLGYYSKPMIGAAGFRGDEQPWHSFWLHTRGRRLPPSRPARSPPTLPSDASAQSPDDDRSLSLFAWGPGLHAESNRYRQGSIRREADFSYARIACDS